jgi:competence protein ComEA
VRRLAVFVAVSTVLAGARPVTAGKAVDGVVNLNTAPAEVLGLLPGVGPAKAAEIAAYRKRHAFRTVDELVRIKGIGRKMVRALRVHLAVAGPTTATAAVARPGSPPPPPAPVPRPPVRPICARPAQAPVGHAARHLVAERWPAHAACLRPR